MTLNKQERDAVVDLLEIIESEARAARHDMRTLEAPLVPVSRRMNTVQSKSIEVVQKIVEGLIKN